MDPVYSERILDTGYSQWYNKKVIVPIFCCKARFSLPKDGHVNEIFKNRHLPFGSGDFIFERRI